MVYYSCTYVHADMFIHYELVDTNDRVYLVRRSQQEGVADRMRGLEKETATLGNEKE